VCGKDVDCFADLIITFAILLFFNITAALRLSESSRHLCAWFPLHCFRIYQGKGAFQPILSAARMKVYLPTRGLAMAAARRQTS
jgi:hypothetical protein